jgi:cobyrinic acid a,c-diamide synthase
VPEITTPRLVLAAPHSGAGKTTVTMGLAAWLSKELAVRCFKVGPDYLDPNYLKAGAGTDVVNLDGWLLNKTLIKQGFYRYSHQADLALIEGVMGLFDGKGSGRAGSSAQVADWLGAPVVLVIDASRSARSLAAVTAGFKQFDPRVNIVGVFLNRIGGATHLKIAKRSIEKLAGVPVVGYLRRDQRFEADSRHLGLVQRPAAELRALAQRVAGAIAETTDRALLLRLASEARAVKVRPEAAARGAVVTARARKAMRIGVARDEAFSFYYHDNFHLLQRLGAELVFFSPLRDTGLPSGIDGLVLGGGWPELHADDLAANRSMLRSIRLAAGSGRPIYAECGGLVYLTEELIVGNRARPMVGLLPARAAMTSKRQGLGYRRAALARDTVLGPKGTVVRGHEFHWSTVTPNDRTDGFADGYLYSDGRREGFASDNLLASYLHINLMGRPELAENFLAACGKETDV